MRCNIVVYFGNSYNRGWKSNGSGEIEYIYYTAVAYLLNFYPSKIIGMSYRLSPLNIPHRISRYFLLY